MRFHFLPAPSASKPRGDPVRLAGLQAVNKQTNPPRHVHTAAPSRWGPLQPSGQQVLFSSHSPVTNRSCSHHTQPCDQQVLFSPHTANVSDRKKSEHCLHVTRVDGQIIVLLTPSQPRRSYQGDCQQEKGSFETVCQQRRRKTGMNRLAERRHALDGG